jgi:Ca2+-binding EF-hand superfamily protein
MRWMIWCKSLAGLMLVFLLSSGAAHAQRGDPADFLRRLDQNQDGSLSPDEFNRLPSFLRDRLGERIDLDRTYRIEEVADIQRRVFEELRQGSGSPGSGGFPGRGSFPPSGGGFPGPTGGFPGSGGGPPGSDRREGDFGRDGSRSDDSRRDGGRGDFGRGGDSGRGDGRSERSSNSATKAADAKKKKERVPFMARLPESYLSKDTDQDGQIGLYEWPRNDLENFKRLDRNGDGFLTPRELVAAEASSPASSGSAVVATVAPSSGSERPGSERSRSESSRGDFGRGDSRRGDFGRGRDRDSGERRSFSTGSADSNANEPQGRAERAFSFMDQNRDDAISEDEWKRSLTVKPLFERAKIEVSFPMKKVEFISKYVQASAAGG